MSLLFADSLTTDPVPFIHKIESVQNRNQETYFELDKTQFQKKLGILCWQVWIQEGPRNETFCIHYIECKTPREFTTIFRNEVFRNRFAAWLNTVFQDHLSVEYSLQDPLLKVDKVLDLPIDPKNPSQGFDLCYLLPLLPSKVEEHREYCRAAMNEKREPTIAACKAFGMIDLKKWIQETNQRQAVLYYQKMTQPLDQGTEAFLALKEHPKALQATQTLRDQTGLSFEELSPKSFCILLFPKAACAAGI